MDRIVKFVNAKFRGAGNSEEVRSQKEELIAGLREKVSDAMAQGKTADEAFRDAIASLDGVEELAETLGGKRRTVYVNRLKFHHSLWVLGTFALVVLVIGALLFIRHDAPGILPYSLQPMLVLSIFLGIMLLAVAVYPLVCGIAYAMKPNKVELVTFDFRKLITGALIGWLAISLFLLAVNMGFPPHYDTEYMSLHNTPFVLGPFDIGIGVVFWFIYPMIGIFTWPLSLILYNVLFKSGKYDAK